MRKRIYRISEDKFDDKKPNIESSDSEIVEEFYEGAGFKGVFSISSTNDVVNQGMVYSNNPYIKLLTPQFKNSPAGINYEIEDHNFHAGDVLEGKFTILCYGVELDIPYRFTCVARPLASGSKAVDSLADFAQIAQHNFAEAQRLFYSDDFADFIKTLDVDTRLLYKGYRGGLQTPISLDEFMVAANLKERMSFDISDKEAVFYGLTGNVKCEIELTRTTWGYINVEVSCDEEWVSVERTSITSDYFLGSVFNMNYYIHTDKMHAGLNFATISFDFNNIHKELKIMATCLAEDEEPEYEIHNLKRIHLALTRKYEEYRLRRITTGQWCNETVELLDSLMTEDEDYNNSLLLYKALCYIANKQKQEALWIISDLKRTIANKRSAEWAFLLYLCTLIEPEESYVNRLTEDVELIFRDHSYDLQIFWCLLFLREEYVKNPAAKLKAISNWVKDGYDTPFLYIEAYYIFLQNPYLLADMNAFTLKILNWARKRGAITKDVAIAFVQALGDCKEYSPRIMAILEEAYRVYPDMHLLLDIVTYLLNTNCVGAEFFKWYKMAVDENLHITGLFEAYINSLALDSIDPMPTVVTMFFKYNNSLDYERLALLYANIILNEKNDPNTYKQYEKAIEVFSLEQMKEGRIDDNLAICYQRLLEVGIIDEASARVIAPYAFMKKIAPFNDNIRRVLVYHEAYSNPIIAMVENNVAYLSIPDGNCWVFLEDRKGNLIANINAYAITDVLDVSEHFVRLIELSKGDMNFVVSDFATRGDDLKLKLSDVDNIQLFINAPDVSATFKRKYYGQFIEFLNTHGREEIILSHLLAKADLSLLNSDVLGGVCEVLIAHDKLEEIYTIITQNNGMKVHPSTLKRVVDYIIAKEGFESNDFLILLSEYLLEKGLYTSNTINYLTRTYLGPTDMMMKIFEKGVEYNCDMALFAERLLIQTLYRDELPDGIQQVFELYFARKNNKMIVEAYLTYVAHQYLCQDKLVSDRAVAYMFDWYLKRSKINESMRIALMKFLCIQGMLEEREKKVLDELLGYSILRNQYFGFYTKCDKELQIKYHLYDKYFVEYQANHKDDIYISYELNDSKVEEEELIEMYDGLFVKQFVLFYGDELKYKILTATGDVLLEAVASPADSGFDSIKSRFSMMNEINRLRIYKEDQALKNAMIEYQGLDVVTRELFTTI